SRSTTAIIRSLAAAREAGFTVGKKLPAEGRTTRDDLPNVEFRSIATSRIVRRLARVHEQPRPHGSGVARRRRAGPDDVRPLRAPPLGPDSARARWSRAAALIATA